jgi:hypothetical protein
MIMTMLRSGAARFAAAALAVKHNKLGSNSAKHQGALNCNTPVHR